METLKACSNCTLLELKRVPFNVFRQRINRSNCTLLELKPRSGDLHRLEGWCSNCTLQDLKQDGVKDIIGVEAVQIAPYWN